MGQATYTYRTAMLDPGIRPRVIRSAGMAYGLIFVAGFAAAVWGLDALQLQSAPVCLAWAKLGLGLALCLPLGALAGWLAARSRWSAISILIWIVVAVLMAWIAGHIPYEGLSWLARLSDPYPLDRPMYAFTPPAGAFTGISMVIGAGIGLLVGLLHLVAAERAWNYSTAAHRLGGRSLLALSVCLPAAILFGALADFQINASTRTALVDVARAIRTALDPAGDLRAAQVPFLESYRDQFTPHYTLYWVKSSSDLETTTIDVRFDTGLLMRCLHAHGHILPCSVLSSDLRGWMEQLMTRGHFTCVGCSVLADRAVRRWLAAALPEFGELREVALLSHQGGWLYQRATFDDGRSIDCRFTGSRPIFIDLCIGVK